MIVVWHVDGLNFSHNNPFEVTKFVQQLSMIYGEKIKLHRVNVHEYLGIYLDCSEPGVSKVSIIKYL